MLYNHSLGYLVAYIHIMLRGNHQCAMTFSEETDIPERGGPRFPLRNLYFAHQSSHLTVRFSSLRVEIAVNSRHNTLDRSTTLAKALKHSLRTHRVLRTCSAAIVQIRSDA